MRRVFGLLVIGLLLFGACSVQDVNAQNSNDAQRIIGSWKPDGMEFIFTFNANGTFAISGSAVNEAYRISGNYFINNTKIFLRQSGQATTSTVIDYNLSADGRILVFSYQFESPNWSTRSGNFWFIKQ